MGRGNQAQYRRPSLRRRGRDDYESRHYRRSTEGSKNKKTKVILLDATGERYTQQKAQALSKIDHMILIAGHYEGAITESRTLG